MSITTIVITFLREKINNESSSIAISEGIEKRLLEGYPDIEKFKGHQQDHLSLVVKGYILSASMHNPIDLRAPPPRKVTITSILPAPRFLLNVSGGSVSTLMKMEAPKDGTKLWKATKNFGKLYFLLG